MNEYLELLTKTRQSDVDYYNFYKLDFKILIDPFSYSVCNCISLDYIHIIEEQFVTAKSITVFL